MKLARLTLIMLILCVCGHTTTLYAQKPITISGTITDESSGETIPGVIVSIKEQPKVVTSSNVYGYYSLGVDFTKTAKATMVIKFFGYATQEIELDIKTETDLRYDIKLSQSVYDIGEAIVTGRRPNENVISEKVGVEGFSVREVSKIPVLLGEKDIIKTLSLTPGVKTTGEGSGGLFVRGGNNNQNLILLDEATVYNSNHLLGFFSTFNSDAIRSVELYKGTAPAQYGGRISSVMDIHMNEGNNREYRFGGGIGLIASNLSIEGPIVAEKSSFLVSGRRTYADLFLKLSPDEELKNNSLYFYDLNAKINYKINDNNRLFISGYFGRDVAKFKDLFGLDWGNTTITARWNHIWSPKLFSNTSLILSDYTYLAKASLFVSSRIRSTIKNVNLKHDFLYYLDNDHRIEFGVSSQYNSIIPGQLESDDISSFIPAIPNQYAVESAVYVSDKWTISPKLTLQYGLRFSAYLQLGNGIQYTYKPDGTIDQMLNFEKGEVVKNYMHLEPRVNLAYIFNPKSSVKLSFTRNTQNIHLLQGSTISNPMDVWIGSSINIKPEISDQVSLGYYRNFNDNTFEFSSEIYYRDMQNQIDLRNGAELLLNSSIEGDLMSGKGRAYGFELMLKKRTGRLSGWVSYTLSRSERQVDGINNNAWYPARQDATHDISVVAMYDISKNWSVSASWIYNTGNALTMPVGKYTVDGEIYYYYTERNGYRMPAYHRLDIGATRTIKKSKKSESSLNFSLYNAYGQKNPFAINFIEDENNPGKIVAEKIYLFTFMPSITYNFKF